jgi:hypothetical protein
MPHATNTEYRNIQVEKLAPTFAAEVTGVDFSKPVEKEVFDEIHRAIVDASKFPSLQMPSHSHAFTDFQPSLRRQYRFLLRLLLVEQRLTYSVSMAYSFSAMQV